MSQPPGPIARSLAMTISHFCTFYSCIVCGGMKRGMFWKLLLKSALEKLVGFVLLIQISQLDWKN
jgi:hypothetical protein